MERGIAWSTRKNVSCKDVFVQYYGSKFNNLENRIKLILSNLARNEELDRFLTQRAK